MWSRETGAGTFPRSARLLRQADFERVYKLGRRHFSASMTVFYWPRPEDGGAGPYSVVASIFTTLPPLLPGV